MKKLSILLMVLLGVSANAQIIDTCEVWFNDTLRYIDTKTSAYSGIGINETNAGGSYGYAGYAQKFEASDTVIIEGVCFYGVMDSGSSFSAAVKMYDGTGGTPGAMITGVTHVVPYLGTGYTGAMNDQSILQCAMFPAPIEWEGDYFVGIENFSSSDMYIARNADGDGAAEGLAFTYYKGVSDPTWDGWYNMYDFGAGWDFDAILRPIVSYRGQSILMYDTTLCLGDTLKIDYDYMLDDSLMYNKFYNPNYTSYTGYSDSHTFDYGDLTGVTTDTFHLYTNEGDYDVTHSVMMNVSAWGGSTFQGTCVVSTEVLDPSFDVVDMSVCEGDTAYFVVDPGYDSYLWDDMTSNDSLVVETLGMVNGEYEYYVDLDLKGCLASDTMTLTIGDLLVDLGNDTTLCLNQNVILTAGSYDSYDWNTGQITETIQIGPFVNPGEEEIVLEVTSNNCLGADTVVVTIDNCLSVEEFEEVNVEVYPNPSNGVFSLDVHGGVKSVLLYNLAGEKVFVSEVLDQTFVDVSYLSEGVYLLEVRTEQASGYKKIQIIH